MQFWGAILYYPQNSHVVFCPDKQHSFDPVMRLDPLLWAHTACTAPLPPLLACSPNCSREVRMSSLVGAGSMLLGRELPPLSRVNIPAMAQLWTVNHTQWCTVHTMMYGVQLITQSCVYGCTVIVRNDAQCIPWCMPCNSSLSGSAVDGETTRNDAQCIPWCMQCNSPLSGSPVDSERHAIMHSAYYDACCVTHHSVMCA